MLQFEKPKRTYVNEVVVKVPKHELINMEKATKTEYIQQKFLINNETTFEQLHANTCAFWGLPKNEFSLFGDHFNELMTQNQETHGGVSRYFEELLLRDALIFLIRPPIDQPKFVAERAKDMAKSI